MTPNGLHTMELPRRIAVGDGNMSEIGKFLSTLTDARSVSLVSGPQVISAVGSKVEESLNGEKMSYTWHHAPDNQTRYMEHIGEEIRGDHADVIVGIGGGRSVDAGKLAASTLGIPYVSVPTAASHDGIASPFASVGGERPHSIVVSAPLGVFVDIGVIKKAPARLLASGCGDLIANIIAVSDWRLGHEKTGEYYGIYAASLARMSADIVMERASAFAQDGPDVRVIVEALISAGVASCIAGSSRPCSGAEHLFSHALDRIAPGRGLHGEKCGLGSIMMAKLHGLDWQGISDALRNVGAPVSAAQIGLDDAEVAEALCIAQDLRPERYTILREAALDDNSAKRLAVETGVL